MKFFQHNDGFINVTVESLTYIDTVEQFIKDIDVSYDLPDGYISSYYEPGVQHYMVKKENLEKWAPENTIFLDPVWEKGDHILASIEDLVNKSNKRKQDEIDEIEKKRQEYLEQSKNEAASNPLAKYSNLLQALQDAGLMDRLSTSSNMSALTTLLLNSGILFDDEKIESSIHLLTQGMSDPLTDREKTLFNKILKKNDFSFTI